MTAERTVRPYGDTLNDGQVQLAFTLPVEHGPLATAAAEELARRMGLSDIRIAHAQPAGEGFTFFIIFGRCEHAVDLSQVRVDGSTAVAPMNMHQVEELMRDRLGRRVVVVGACVGSDAHTVGIDAIMNMKGCRGDYGLERYSTFEAHNLGAQVTPEELLRAADRLRAEVVLVSQVVTQKNVHVQQLTRVIELFEAEGFRDRVLMIVGGPSIDNRLAKELGYDAGFGRDTRPSQVAAFIAHRLIERQSGRSG